VKKWRGKEGEREAVDSREAIDHGGVGGKSHLVL